MADMFEGVDDSILDVAKEDQDDLSNSPRAQERSRSRSPLSSPRNHRRDHDGRDRGRRDRSRSRDRDRQRKINSRKVLITNIPYETTWQKIKDLCRRELDAVPYIEMYETPEGKPLGSCMAEFSDKDTAQRAVDKLHRMKMGDRNIIVREETEKDRRRFERDRGLLGRSGQGSSFTSGAGGPRGGGFRGAAMPNVDLPPGITMDILNRLNIQLPVTDTVFVANLYYKVTENDLREVFELSGPVVHVELKKDKDGKSKGYGTVRFNTEFEAVQAVSMFHDHKLCHRKMTVKIDKMADSRRNKKLPEGLESIGMGLGPAGNPVQSNNLGSGPMGGGTGNFGGIGGGGLNPMGGMGNDMAPMGGLGNLGMGGGGMGSMSGGMSGGMAGGGLSLGGGMSSGLSGQLSSLMGSLSGGNFGAGGSSSFSDIGGMNMNRLGGMSDLGGGGAAAGFGALGSLSGGLGGFGGMSGLSDSVGSGTGMSMNLGGGGGSYRDRDIGRNDRRGGNQRRNGGGGGGGVNDSRRSVFVRNLPFSYTWQTLKDEFSNIGPVVFAEIKTDNKGKSRGCGIVRYGSQEDAERAIALMNGARLDGRDIEVRADAL